ncbi:hypothetical protein DMI65_17060 [Escherichia coli]|nr:hypothetical protein [Escherichia coli]
MSQRCAGLFSFGVEPRLLPVVGFSQNGQTDQLAVFFVSSCALLFSAARCVSMVWLALLSRHDCQPAQRVPAPPLLPAHAS